MATITSRGERQWRVQIRRKGHDPITRTFETYADAKRWAASRKQPARPPSTINNLTNLLSAVFRTAITALNPYLGIRDLDADRQAGTGDRRGVAELVREEGLLGEDQLADILKPENMTRPRRLGR